MLHHMKLQPEPFQKIKSGNKQIELRLYDKKRQRIQVGDQIEFMNLADKNKKIRVVVVALHRYKTFKELFQNLSLIKCGYSPEEAPLANYEDMEQYYPKEKQLEYEVVGIEFQILNWRSPELKKISQYLCKLLRHHPEIAGITLDENGWANVEELIRGVAKTHPLDLETLVEIVRTDDKQRYSFSDDRKRIRCNQGHSMQVDVGLEESKPPDVLWHGTSEKYEKYIEKEGLIPKTRLYVHLSASAKNAHSVGSRHGKPIVYEIDAKHMFLEGFIFYKAVNDVWQTKHVPARFLKKL